MCCPRTLVLRLIHNNYRNSYTIFSACVYTIHEKAFSGYVLILLYISTIPAYIMIGVELFQHEIAIHTLIEQSP